MIDKTLPLNSIVYCNSHTHIAEKCQIKSQRFKWDTPNHEYGYTVYSHITKETFNCPTDCMYMTAYQAKSDSEDGFDTTAQKYKSNINSIEDLMNFSANHMRDVKLDEAAIEAFKDKTQELLGITIK